MHGIVSGSKTKADNYWEAYTDNERKKLGYQ